MVEQATPDAYNDDEQRTGLFTMIEERLAVPFTSTVLGVEVNGIDAYRQWAGR